MIIVKATWFATAYKIRSLPIAATNEEKATSADPTRSAMDTVTTYNAGMEAREIPAVRKAIVKMALLALAPWAWPNADYRRTKEVPVAMTMTARATVTI